MTAAIPTQRGTTLSKRELARLDRALSKAANRLRFAQISAETDPDGTWQAVDDICLWVIREAYAQLGPQRCAALDQPETFRIVGQIIIDRAALVDGVR